MKRLLIGLFLFGLFGIFGGRVSAETPTATFTVNSRDDFPDALINGTCATAGGVCTLRAAIQEANATLAKDTILFEPLPGNSMTIDSALPSITRPVDILNITGSTCPETGRLGLRQSPTAPGTINGLTLAAGSSGSKIRGLAVYSFSGDGIRVESNDNTIDCNFIGTALNGYTLSGVDGTGISVSGDNNNIGTPNNPNVIGDNGAAGILLNDGTDNDVVGNFIGVGRIGYNNNAVSHVGNVGNGIYVIGGDGNAIGDGTAAGRNIISDNGGHGIRLNGTKNATINNNYIGVSIDGVIPSGDPASNYNNVLNGIRVQDGFDNRIENNVIANNDDYGIAFDGSATGTTVVNNRIGVDVTDSAESNNEGGILINSGDANQNLIERNQIAHNGGHGILTAGGSTGNTFTQNSIYNNGALGIDLGADEVDENDKGDPDGGDNLKHNYPIIIEASNIGHIEGVLDSTAGTHRVEFFQNDSCDNVSSNGEGQTYLGFVNVTTPGDGTQVPFSVDFVPFAAGFLTATATDSNGNTSEFSKCSEIDIEPIPLIVNSDGDAGDSNLGDGLCQTASRAPECTLRAALEQTNAFATSTHITFSDERFILPNSPLPTITTPTNIDGLSQGSCSSTVGVAHGLDVTLDGVNAGVAHGLHFTAGSEGSTVKGLNIGRFQQNGILIESSNNDILCNHIGEDGSGSFGNGGSGVFVNDSDSNDIGGGGSGRNVISGNSGRGVEILSGSGNRVRGNYIGTNLTGKSPSANSLAGVYIGSPDTTTTVGGSGSLGNVISGNKSHGVEMAFGLSATNKVVVTGNIIGRSSDSAIPLGNDGYGVYATNSIDFDITENIISSNTQEGIYIADDGADLQLTQNTIANNVIGSDQTNASFGNRGGIYVGALTAVTISDNVIGSNQTNPALKIACDATVDSTCSDNLPNGNVNVIVEDNFIGVQSNGTTIIASSAIGVHLENAEGAVVRRNVIAASSASANVLVENDGSGNASIGNTLSDNQVGISADGNTDLNAATNGVIVNAGTLSMTISGNQIGADGGVALIYAGDNGTISNNAIGTNTAGTLNVGGTIGLHVDGGDDNSINGNIIGYNGVGVQLEEATNNNLYGNGIGTNVAGTLDIGNSSHGVYVLNDSDNNAIGGDTTLPYNQIRNNGGVGVVVGDAAIGVSTGNSIFANEISDNGLLGIDLNNDDVTPNDDATCDSDTGPNDKQNYPTLTGVSTGGNILGTLKSRPSRNYRIDVFSSPTCDVLFNHGEGSQYFGSTTIQMDVSGSFDFSVTQANPAQPHQYFTAVATNLLTGDTSEFSACFTDGVPTAVGFREQGTGDSKQLMVTSWQVWLLVGLVGVTLVGIWQGRRGIVLLVIGVVMVGVAIAPSETFAEEESVPNSCGAFDDLLQDGSSAQSGAGIIIGAVGGSLTEDVRVSATSAPEPEPAYDEFAVKVSDYYQLSAEDLRVAPSDKPFLVGVPRPTGFAADNLAVALLSDFTDVLDVPMTGLGWLHTPVNYDSENDLLIFTITRLSASNLVFTVVQDASFELMEAPSRATSSDVSFVPTCTGTPCNDAVKLLYTNELVAAYDNFVGFHGFNPPALVKGIPLFSGHSVPVPSITPINSYIGVVIDDGTSPGCAGNQGYYDPTAQKLFICTQGAITTTVRETIRHELFHAIQYAYPTIAQDPDWHQEWVMEGTAEMAGASVNAPHTTGAFGRRKVTDSLHQVYPVDSGVIAYAGEEFWFYFLDEYSQPFSYLETIFVGGIELADVDATVGNLGMLYWDWIKNQAHEHYNLTDGAFTAGDACKTVGVTADPNPLVPTTIVATTNEYTRDVFLLKVDSAIVKFKIQSVYGGRSAIITVEDAAGQTAPNFKVYDSRSDGADGSCQNVAEGERRIDNLRNGQEFTVVIANTSLTTGKGYTAKVTIVSSDE